MMNKREQEFKKFWSNLKNEDADMENDAEMVDDAGGDDVLANKLEDLLARLEEVLDRLENAQDGSANMGDEDEDDEDMDDAQPVKEIRRRRVSRRCR